MSERFDCRDAFQRTLIELAEPTTSGSSPWSTTRSARASSAGSQQAFPDRLINVGIAEQNMVGVGAGLANGGRIPFVSGAAPFLTGRALEQIKADVAYSNANVKLCGQSPGMAYGELGPTHHSIEDLAWLRAIANLPVIVPADPIETEQVDPLGGARPTGPVFIRVSRMPVRESSTRRLRVPARHGDAAARRRRRDDRSPAGRWSSARWRPPSCSRRAASRRAC